MSKTKKYLPKGTKALKNSGFNPPSNDIIDASFDVMGVYTKKDRNQNTRTWVPIVIHDKDKDHAHMFEGCVLAGLDASPVAEDLSIDESMVVTWKAGEREPRFRKPA